MEDEQDKKILWLRIGVVILFVLILSLWALNMRNLWHSKNELVPPTDNSTWENFRAEVEKSIEDMKAQIDRIPAADPDLEDISQPADTNNNSELETGELFPQPTYGDPGSPSIPDMSPGIPAPVDNQKSYCPAWINCMPTVVGPGEVMDSRPCTIPPGCEGITQIAY